MLDLMQSVLTAGTNPTSHETAHFKRVGRYRSNSGVGIGVLAVLHEVEMKFIDMFCGMGTIRMGFEQARHECVYSIEWDKHKRRIYEVIYGNEPEGRDITDIRADQLPAADCWTFGAPCQDFSIAGLRDGLGGDRSSLVREVFRLVRETAEEHRPEWLLYENVKGMLSSNKGLDYLEILFEMASLGYDIEYQLLNSKDFGVPQNRERVYTLGHLRARGERKVFPVGCVNTKFDASYDQIGNPSLDENGCFTAIDSNYYKGYGIRGNKCRAVVTQIGNVMPTATRDNPNQGRVYSPDGLAPCLNKMEGGGREPCIIDDRGRRNKEHKLHDICPTLRGQMHGNQPEVMTLNTKDENGKEPPQQNRIYTTEGLMTALSAQLSGRYNIAGSSRIRRLTPRECMRLQGVADNVTDKLIAAGISDTQLYRAAGDACTVNVVYEIAKRLERNQP